MLTDVLKDRMKALPGDQFVATWECVEALEQALEEGGPVAALALTYVVAAREQHVAEIVVMQQARIANMAASAVNQHENLLALSTSRNQAYDKIAKLERRIKRLTPAKKKTKRKA